MLGHRLRRWPNIKPALGEYIAFAVLAVEPTIDASKLWGGGGGGVRGESSTSENKFPKHGFTLSKHRYFGVFYDLKNFKKLVSTPTRKLSNTISAFSKHTNAKANGLEA